MALTDLINKIVLEDKFSDAFDKYDKRVEGSDSKTARFGATLGKITTVAGVAGGAILGTVAAINRLSEGAAQNQQAMFNVAYAASAANREFGQGVGTVDSWTESVRETSDQLRVFGDRDVADATSRLIDMTKRLGFTEQQMRVLLTRTGDLSAGKVDLAGGIERVTAAMRGEAESAEFLGLSLNETAVRAYAEAHGLVWKNLSDVEKAQERYNLFLSQTDSLQGRAAASAETIAGQEAELARLRERQINDIGAKLLPLRQGEIEALKKTQGEWFNLGDVVLNVQSAIQAGLAATGAIIVDFTTILADAVDVIGKSIDAIANQGDLSKVQAALDAIDKGKREGQGFIDKYKDLGKFFGDAFDQIKAGNLEAINAQTALQNQTEDTAQSYSDMGSAGAAAAQKIAEKTAELKNKQLQLTTTFNQRLADLEYDHGQRIIRIQQDIARATIEAAAEAAAAREEAAAKLAQGLADIERDLAQDNADAQHDFEQDMDRLRQESRDAERDRARGIRDINRDLADDLRDLHYDAEQDRAKITEKFNDQRLAIEKKYAGLRARVDDEYSNEYENADAFRRQILKFNRDEKLKQLDTEEQAEQTALETQTQNAISELETRVQREEEILNQQAQRKRERLEEEYNDKVAALERERQALEENLALEQQKRDEAAALARQKLQERNAEELARIDEQEAQKVQRAQEALAKEQQNYEDRLASLQRHHQQELSQIQAQFTIIEAQERAHFLRRYQEALRFSQQMSGLPFLGGGSGGSSLGDTLSLSNPGRQSGQASDTIIINQYGVPGGYAGAQQAARTVDQIMNGF